MAILGAIAVPHPPLIVPAVGRGDQRHIQATVDAYGRATRDLLALNPDCIVVTSPHAPFFRDGFHVTTDARLDGDMARFRAPEERISAECDVELAREIVRRANDAGIPAVGSDRYHDDMDHGTYVPLYFVREAYRASSPEVCGDIPCPIVRIGLSQLSSRMHRELGRVIAESAASLGRKVAFIASGDLSHKLLPEGPYGFAPEGPVFDKRIGEIFSSGNLDELYEFDEDFCEAAAECGLRSFQIMVGALDGTPVETAMLSNEGPFGVGYGVATVMPKGAVADSVYDEVFSRNADGNEVADGGYRGYSDDDVAGAGATAASHADGIGVAAAAQGTDPHIRLARLSVETFVRTGRPAKLPDDVPRELLDRQAGVFVSLHERGDLRGCIGTISATEPSIAAEILQNGISACSRDPRFDPVREDELDYLEYSVDVLGDAEPISSPDELDPRRYGVIVTKGWKRGLLLPNLEGVDTVDVQLSIAKRKAGISPADDDVRLERFEVVRHTRGGEPRNSVL